MKRNVDMNEISDGKLYHANDLVKADCGDCKGCHACCCDMGSSIVLDPFDIYRLCLGMNTSFEQLLAEHIELNVSEKVLLPNLKMGVEKKCSFLNEEGRCAIHRFRPGICRLFPLGRIYENGSFQYFLQTQECKNENRTKIKVRKWIQTEPFKQYESFIADWHYFIVKLQEEAKALEDDSMLQTLNLYLLRTFYMKPYEAERDFYEQFYARFDEAKRALNI